jgi:hypothetical protein
MVIPIQHRCSDEDYPEIKVPLLDGNLYPNEAVDYNYTMVPLPTFNNRTVQIVSFLICQIACGFSIGPTLNGITCSHVDEFWEVALLSTGWYATNTM